MNESYDPTIPDEESPQTLPDGLIASAMKSCWRCGKPNALTALRCPYCSAKLLNKVSVSVDPDAQAITRLLVVFGLLLLVSIISGAVIQPDYYIGQHAPPASDTELLRETFVFEGIDSVLILAAWAWIRPKFREQKRSVSRRTAVWVTSLPVLAITLLANRAYHLLLLDWLEIVPVAHFAGHSPMHLVGWIAAICIQPAVVEELFFRYLAYGVLRPVMGGHTTVWITATMFALAHLGAPLSMPILFGLGIVLGYSRWASGGIMLPITLHFLHNAVVMILNGAFS